MVCHHGKGGNSWDFRPSISSITFSAIVWISTKYFQNRTSKPTAGQDSDNETTSALSLFEAITLWTLLSLTAYTLLAAIWGEGDVSERLFSGWRIKSSPEVTPLERVKTTLTTIGGIGGVSFLVIKFRQQDIAEKQHKHSEDERLKAEEAEVNRKFEAKKLEANKKLVDAVQQLGNKSPQVRIAGVYALADVADTYGSEKYGVDYNKRAVEIICGYLRTPRSDDGAVESTILRVMTQHLRSDTHSQKNTWSKFKIDLHGANFIETVDLSETKVHSADFRECIFNKGALFRKTEFLEPTSFAGAHFGRDGAEDNADFEGAKFTKDSDFSNCNLQGENSECNEYAINFKDAHFGSTPEHEVKFYGAILRQAAFTHSTFYKVDFRNSDLTDSVFKGTNFWGNVKFSDMSNNKIILEHTEFTADPSIEGSMKLTDADFSYAETIKSTTFSAVILEKPNFSDATLDNVKFINTSTPDSEISSARRYEVKFVEPVFDRAIISNTEFSGIAMERPSFKDTKLQNVRFNPEKDKFNTKPVMMDADFTNSSSSFTSGSIKEVEFQLIFQGHTKFTNSKFENVDFKDSEFIKQADFRGATFEVKACFELTKFLQGANFTYSTFGSGFLTNFEKCIVSFPVDLPLNSSGVPKGSNWSGPNKYWRPSHVRRSPNVKTRTYRSPNQVRNTSSEPAVLPPLSSPSSVDIDVHEAGMRKGKIEWLRACPPFQWIRSRWRDRSRAPGSNRIKRHR